MNVLETLIGKGWTPTRGVVLAFGFDEEASGTHVSVLRRLMRCPFADQCLLQGAAAIGPYLLETFGKNTFAIVVDEGGQWLLLVSTMEGSWSSSTLQGVTRRSTAPSLRESRDIAFAAYSH